MSAPKCGILESARPELFYNHELELGEKFGEIFG